MRIAPDVEAITMRGGAMGFLVTEERLTLIDAGLPGSAAPFDRAIAALGRRRDELARIVCTHGHPDHVGGVPELAGADTEVYLHPADADSTRVGFADVARRPSRAGLFAAMSPDLRRARPLVDGEVLPVLGGLLAVHTPGHTPGSVCLYAARDRLLFTGDVLQVRRDRVTYASRIFSTDIRAARRSVQRLAELDVETIVFSHFPPWRRDANAVLRDLAARAEGR